MRLLIVGLTYAPEPVGIGPYTTGLLRHSGLVFRRMAVFLAALWGEGVSPAA